MADEKPRDVVRFDFNVDDIKWFKCGFVVGQDVSGKLIIITDSVESLKIYPPDDEPEG